jgi:hypothetical protein
MTAGPARRIVTLLPKNKPTPMAPPMAIMVSWRWLRRRWRPSTSVVGGLLPAGVLATIGRGRSVMAADTGTVKDHEIDVLLENVRHGLYVVHCVVHMERYPQAVVTVRGDDPALGELLHQ